MNQEVLFTRELVELVGFTFYFVVVLVLVVRIDISQIKAFYFLVTLTPPSTSKHTLRRSQQKLRHSQQKLRNSQQKLRNL
jgi:hypothetical protein